MKRKYTHIHFHELDPKPKTKVFECRNNISFNTLGHIGWNCGWRRYVFIPVSKTGTKIILDALCLCDISDFIKQLMDERKEVKL
jgi:hypothetical protein